MPTLIRALVVAARENVNQRNWYGALVLALSLPDQCSFLEAGGQKSQERYVNWFDRWVGQKYVHNVGPDFSPIKVVFLDGQDLYALRCAFFHQGSGGLDKQRAKRFLSQIQLTYPDHGSDAVFHQIRENNVLYVQVDRLTQDICDGVDAWLAERHAVISGNEHALNLATFRPVSSFPCPGENNFGSNAYRNRTEAEENGVYFPPNWPFFIDTGST